MYLYCTNVSGCGNVVDTDEIAGNPLEEDMDSLRCPNCNSPLSEILPLDPGKCPKTSKGKRRKKTSIEDDLPF